MKKEKEMDPVRRIAAACDDVIARSNEIVRCASTDKKALLALFKKKEIRVTSEICCELLMSIAASSSVEDLRTNRENFKRMRKQVLKANDALALCLQSNPQVMSAIMNAEDTFIDLLMAADPTVRLMAGLAQQYLGVVKSILTSFFSEIGLRIEEKLCGGSSWGGRLRNSLSAPLGSMVIKKGAALFSQYGDGRCDRSADIAFMRSLYDKESNLRSWPKVIAYVRSGCGEADGNFARCAEIRAHVQAWAKKEKGGADRVWRSLAQQLKLSHGRKPPAEFSPVAIPDRNWA